MNLELTQAQVRALFDYDPKTGVVLRKSSSLIDPRFKRVVGDLNTRGYLSVWIKPKRYQLHRIIWLWVYGVWPTKNIDHINRVPNDNRLSNLREASQLENMHNRSKSTRNWSGYIGVHWYPERCKWQAQISADGHKHHLGYFDSLELASAAYQAAKLIYHPTASEAQQGA